MCRSLFAIVISGLISGLCAAAPPEELVARGAMIQESSGESRLPYSEGTVFAVTFIRTKAGLTNDYLKNLRAVYHKVMDDAKNQGLILSYKVFLAPAANRADWDVMTMIEYKNMAALDGLDEKWEAVYAKVIGNEQAQRSGSQQRGKVRDILGEKIIREIIFK
jgi:hypothetical protein